MIFECADSPFGGVATMYARWDQLITDVLASHVLLESFRTFVVNPLKFGAASCGDQSTMELFVGSKYAGSRSVGHRMCQNSVTIIIVQNEYVIVTSTGWSDEAAGLVREYLPSSTTVVPII